MRYIFIILITVSCSQKRGSGDSITYNKKDLVDSIMSFSDSLKVLDNLAGQSIKEVRSKIASLEQEKKVLESKLQEDNYTNIKTIVDSSAIVSLRIKLSQANNEIARLRGELTTMAKSRSMPEREVMALIQPAIETPDENSVIVSLDGSSKRGDIPIPENLSIYLVPYSKRLKREVGYDMSCNELPGEQAKYYNGLYFFNDVEPGKYLIKICTYMGNYKLIDKQAGKLSLTMKVAPPIQ